MDPFSVSTALIPLITLAGACLAECYQYGCSVRDAPHEARRLVDELTSLSGVLVGLQGLVASSYSASSSTDTAYANIHDTKSNNIHDTKTSNSNNLYAINASSNIQALISECNSTLQDLLSHLRLVTGTSPNIRQGEKAIRRLLWPIKKQATLEMVGQVERMKTKLILALNGMSTRLALQQTEVLRDVAWDVAEIATEQRVKKRQEVLEWLTPHDSSVAHRRAVQLRCEDTCTWIWEEAAFERWRKNSSKHGALWVNGLAGYGKTVLTSFVIEMLQQQSQANLAYHYFDASDTTSLSLLTFMGSLLKQFCVRLDPLPDNIIAEYDAQMAKKGSPNPPDANQLHDMLDQIICSQSDPIIVLDGVDESPECEAICEVLNALADEQGLAHVLLISRPDSKIRRELSRFEELQMPESLLEQDVGRYVNSRMKSEPRLGRLNDQLRTEASKIIRLKSHGMFRWAQCQLDDISKFRTDRAVRQALHALPQNLEDAYTLMLTRIPKPDVDLARRALMWLAYSPCLILLSEVAEAATYETDCKTIDTDDRLADPADIVEICGSLIAFDIVTHEIRLAHQSVRECLETLKPEKTAFAMPEKIAHAEMADVCLSYLLMDNFEKGMAKTTSDLEKLLAAYPLLKYAVENWIFHIRRADAEQDMQDKILRLFTPKSNPRFILWLQVIFWSTRRGFRLPGTDDDHGAQPQPLYYAASYGLIMTVKRLVEAGAEVNDQAGRFGGTALHAACWRNHPEVAQYLLEQGANPHIQDYNGAIPADLATMHGSSDPSFVALMYEYAKQSKAPYNLASAVGMIYNRISGTGAPKPRHTTVRRTEFWKTHQQRDREQKKPEVFEIG